jgi:hypothetical protein
MGEKLSRLQDQAVAALLQHATIGRAAEAVGVNEKTLRRWLALPDFRRAYLDHRRQVVDQAVALVQQMGGSAVLALGEALRHEDVNARVRAAKIVLDMGRKGVELDDVMERLEALEAAARRQGGKRR